MNITNPGQPSVLSDPIYRRPHLPGALARPVDLVLAILAFGGGFMGCSQALAAIRHADLESAEALSLRELARIEQSNLWLAAVFAVSLLAAGMLILRLLYRVHRCELLLRWSGIDESKLLAGPRPSRARDGESPV